MVCTVDVYWFWDCHGYVHVRDMRPNMDTAWCVLLMYIGRINTLHTYLATAQFPYCMCVILATQYASINCSFVKLNKQQCMV